MDSKNIIDYIKKNYPKLIFKPLRFKQSRALAFIIDDDNLIIGFINSDGTLCKLIDPINTKSLENDNIQNIINRLPIVNGFSFKDKQRLLRIFENRITTVSKADHNKTVKALTKQIEQYEKQNQEYKTLFDGKSNEIILIQRKYEDDVKIINDKYNTAIKELNECKAQIVNQNDAILEGINKYKDDVKEFVLTKDLKIEDLEKIHKRDLEEYKTLQDRLNLLLKNEEEYKTSMELNQDVISDYDVKLAESSDKALQLQNAIEKIKDELRNTQEELSKKEMAYQLLEGYKSRCKDKILNEKEQIINAIGDYNQKWKSWAENIKEDVTEYKRKLVLELKTVQENLKSVLSSNIEKSNLSDNETRRLKQNILDVESSLKNVINEQLMRLSERDEQIRLMQDEMNEMKSERESQQSDYSEMQLEIDKLREENSRIPELQRKLQEVEQLLLKNNNTRIEAKIDYENCYSIITNFVALNNIFFRKQEIIKHLDDILTNDLGEFKNLNESIKTSIKQDFYKLKDEILNHIKFLNLSDYINSPNFEYLKSKSTRSRVPESFCKDLSNLLDYWNVNKTEYREQDRRLINIYEDLSGAVRIYIRIKPLVGKDIKNKTISLQTIENKKLKSLYVDCSANPTTKYKQKLPFGDFYGIYEEDYSNLDIYTGQRSSEELALNSLQVNINEIIESSDSISPGLYSTFKQVEDGYSIVLFGYGLSGSGKTFSLLGSKGSPGILHYGLANLEGVANIRLKNLFEQYYDRVNFNNRQVSGKIHTLINKIPQLKDVSIDETGRFEKRIPSHIDIKNLKVNDIYSLTDIIDKYRIEAGRIKQTPNNPVSSRSHLYFVFEIEFQNGKRGYITIVDTAGRESPVDIFNLFIDTSKGNTIGSVMAPPPVGGVSNIQRSLKQEYKDLYIPENVFEILKEGFYINETINHLIYYFNIKNGRTIQTYRQKIDDRYNVMYKVENYFVQPQGEYDKIDSSNNSLMIPILKFLDNLSNKNKSDLEWKPTKFITLCCVRQEDQYCDQTMETLKFAQNVKSS